MAQNSPPFRAKARFQLRIRAPKTPRAASAEPQATFGSSPGARETSKGRLSSREPWIRRHPRASRSASRANPRGTWPAWWPARPTSTRRRRADARRCTTPRLGAARDASGIPASHLMKRHRLRRACVETTFGHRPWLSSMFFFFGPSERQFTDPPREASWIFRGEWVAAPPRGCRADRPRGERRSRALRSARLAERSPRGERRRRGRDAEYLRVSRRRSRRSCATARR